MQFLRTLFWVVVTAIVVVFTMHNWRTVTIDLFGGLQADVKLPVLLAIFFLAGFVPLYVYHRATRWRLQRAIPPAAMEAAPPVATPTVVAAAPAIDAAADPEIVRP